MPSMTAFGRRWQIGTDDFVFPGALDCTVKTCWLVGALIVLFQSEMDVCSNGDQLRLYLYGTIAALLIIIVADVMAIKYSATGSIMDSDSRKLVVPLVYLRLFLEALDTGWNIVGTVWTFGDAFHCFEIESPGTYKFIRRFIICNWISLVIVLLLLVFFYDPLGGKDHTDEVLQSVKSQFWENRFKRYCCYFGFQRKSDMVRDGFKEVGKVFAFILKDTNLISSDVWAGLFALYQREKEKTRQDLLKVTTKPVEDSFTYLERRTASNQGYNSDAAEDVRMEQQMDIVLQIDHYFKFVNGSNGWRGFLINNRKERAICRLWNSIVCCGCWASPYTTQIQGDNCCFCSMSALKETITDIQEEDVIYVSFKNDYYEVPFYIILDHPTKSYIVAIRGTFTGKDIITDLTAWPVPMDVPGLPSSYTVHHGMNLAAKLVLEKLKKLGILQRLKTKYSDYGLVLVGQSLGGGTATLLGLMLRSEFPMLKVYAYNPPGGLLSLDAAEESDKFTTSVVYGTDALARLSLPSLDIFRKKVIDTIFDCRTPKYKLVCGALATMFGVKPRFKFVSDLGKKGTENTAYMSTSASGDDEISGIPANMVSTKNEIGPIMYLPGKILYVTQNPRWSELDTQNSHHVNSKFRMRWANRREFLEIIVSSRMYADHWHFQMLDAFEEYKNPKKSVNDSAEVMHAVDIV